MACRAAVPRGEQRFRWCCDKDYSAIVDPDMPPMTENYELYQRPLGIRRGVRINGEPMAWREIMDKVRKEAAHARGN
jgi:hypothetical protein